ncbi:MAG: alpha/beta hydrolase [Pseudoxanthomonas sp.]|nr:alpha/beta hydrolase [Pseudoxanthomonas sp.]
MSQPELLPCVVRETGPSPAAAIVWLHGLGADGHDFEPIVPELVDPAWPALRFVFPHAPVRPVTINMGMPMRAWYDIKAMSLDQRADEAGLTASVAQVEALLADQVRRGIAPGRLFLAGFSQGGVVALQAGLRHGAPLAGIIGLSCYLPMAQALADARAPANTATPVLLMHGEQDPVVPLALGEHARATLAGWGQPVQWHTYRMQHSVCMEQILDLRRWLGARLAAIA